jgi:hypothetical protein
VWTIFLYPAFRTFKEAISFQRSAFSFLKEAISLQRSAFSLLRKGWSKHYRLNPIQPQAPGILSFQTDC